VISPPNICLGIFDIHDKDLGMGIMNMSFFVIREIFMDTKVEIKA
jgi:hypothetical protein